MKVSKTSFGWILAAIAAPLCAQSAPSSIPDFNEAVQGLVGSSSSAPCGSSIDSWTQAGFRNVTVESYPVEQFYGRVQGKKFTHGMELTLVNFRGTGWDRSEIKSRYSRVAEIYAQCGVKISRMVYVEADPYQGISVVDNGGRRDDLTISKATPDTPRPVIYLLEHAKNEHGLPQMAYSWRNGSTHTYTPDNSEVPLEQPLKNTAWITNTYKNATLTPSELGKAYEIVEGVPFSANGKPYTVVQPSYSVEAHELGHILTNSGHYEGRGQNFLSGSERQANDKINASQCEAIRRHPLVKPL